MDFIGKPFPAFELEDQEGKIWSGASLHGTWTVVYAYPKDMTPGCTIQAHEFTALYKDYKKAGISLFGLSPDSVDRHVKFCEKDGITYPLLADPDKKLIEALGVWVERSMYGKKFMGVNRSTWVINPNGEVVLQWSKVKPKDHAKEVLEKVKELMES